MAVQSLSINKYHLRWASSLAGRMPGFHVIVFALDLDSASRVQLLANVRPERWW